jgi:hypothetical protein
MLQRNCHGLRLEGGMKVRVPNSQKQIYMGGSKICKV